MHAALSDAALGQPPGTPASRSRGSPRSTSATPERLRRRHDPARQHASDPADRLHLLPDADDAGGDVFFGPSGAAPVAGNYDCLTILHELGHALGPQARPRERRLRRAAGGIRLDGILGDDLPVLRRIGRPQVYNETWGYAADVHDVRHRRAPVPLRRRLHHQRRRHHLRVEPDDRRHLRRRRARASRRGPTASSIRSGTAAASTPTTLSAYATGVRSTSPRARARPSRPPSPPSSAAAQRRHRQRQRLQRPAVPRRPALADRERHRRPRRRHDHRQRRAQRADGSAGATLRARRQRTRSRGGAATDLDRRRRAAPTARSAARAATCSSASRRARQARDHPRRPAARLRRPRRRRRRPDRPVAARRDRAAAAATRTSSSAATRCGHLWSPSSGGDDAWSRGNTAGDAVPEFEC